MGSPKLNLIGTLPGKEEEYCEGKAAMFLLVHPEDNCPLCGSSHSPSAMVDLLLADGTDTPGPRLLPFPDIVVTEVTLEALEFSVIVIGRVKPLSSIFRQVVSCDAFVWGGIVCLFIYVL